MTKQRKMRIVPLSIAANKATLSDDTNETFASLTVDDRVDFDKLNSLHVLTQSEFHIDSVLTIIVSSILRNARSGVSELLLTSDIDMTRFGLSFKSSFGNLMNLWMQMKHDDTYLRWMLKQLEVAEFPVDEVVNDVDVEKWKVSNAGQTIKTLILLIASQTTIHKAYFAENDGDSKLFDRDVFSYLVKDEKLSKLATTFTKNVIKAANQVREAMQKDSQGDGNESLLGLPISDKDEFYTVIKNISEDGQKTISQAYESVHEFLSEICSKVPYLIGGDSDIVINNLSFMMIRSEFLRVINMKSFYDVEDAKLKATLPSIGITSLNKLHGQTVVEFLKDLRTLSYSYSQIARTLRDINNVRYSASADLNLIDHYVNTMNAMSTVTTEGASAIFLNKLKANGSEAWNGSLASMLFNVAKADVNKSNSLNTESFPKLVTLMNKVLDDNPFFTISRDSPLSLFSSEYSRVSTDFQFSMNFSIDMHSISDEKLFGTKSTDINSLLELVDLASKYFLKPSETTIFGYVYRLCALDAIMSDEIRHNVRSRSGAEIESFSLNESTRKVLMSEINSVSTAIMVQLGIYYRSCAIVRNIIVARLQKEFEIIDTVCSQDGFDAAKLFFNSEPKFKVLLDDISKYINDLYNLSNFNLTSDVSEVSDVDVSNLPFSDSLLETMSLQDEFTINYSLESLVSLPQMRAVKARLYSLAHGPLSIDNPTADLTNTNDPDKLASRLKRACLDLATTSHLVGDRSSMIKLPLSDFIEHVRRQYAKKSDLQVYKSSFGNMATTSFNLRSLVELKDSTIKPSSSSRRTFDVVDSVKAIAKRNRTMRYKLPSSSAELQIKLFSMISPSLLHFLCLVDYKNLHTVDLPARAEPREIKIIDERRGIEDVLHHLAIDPNMLHTAKSLHLCKPIIEASGIFKLKPIPSASDERMSLLSVLSFTENYLKSAISMGYVTLCFLPLDVISELTQDSLTFYGRGSKNKLIITERYSGMSSFVKPKSQTDISLHATYIRTHPTYRATVSPVTAAESIFDTVVKDSILKIWNEDEPVEQED